MGAVRKTGGLGLKGERGIERWRAPEESQGRRKGGELLKASQLGKSLIHGVSGDLSFLLVVRTRPRS